MGVRRNPVSWLGLAAGILWATSGTQAADPSRAGLDSPRAAAASSHTAPGADIPLERLPPATRAAVRRVLDRPTLNVQGPEELFRGQPALYLWLLGHPDQCVQLWRGLGARCMDVINLGNGWFGWTDGQGTQFHWETVYADGHCRIWYGEGSSRPTFLFPTIPARAVVVMRHTQLHDSAGRPLIQHQSELFLQLDNRAAALITHLLGSSAPRLGEQGLAQMQMFFSALVWYLDRHPERAEVLLRKLGVPSFEK
jgi:hypothetical protein